MKVTTITSQKTRVDEQRIQVLQLQERLEQIDGKIAQVEIRKAREQAAARDDEARATYGAFLKAAVAESRVLEKERQAAAMAVKIAQDKLALLFEEQKRYEIAEQQRITAETREENRRERIELDEIGSVIHERKKAE